MNIYPFQHQIRLHHIRFSWVMTAGSLPDGITLEGQTGVISSQATSLDMAHFTIRVRDSSNPSLTDVQHLTLVAWISKNIEGDLGSVPPEDIVLKQNYPNPFNQSTLIEYKLYRRAHVTVEIFNVSGQWIRSLVEGEQSIGSYATEWDGRSDNGHELTTGLYYYRVAAGDHVKVKKMLLLK